LIANGTTYIIGVMHQQ